MTIEYRDYAADRDREAAHRIWTEVGWLEKGKEQQMDSYVEAGRSRVVAIDGEAECLVNTMPCDLRYLSAEIPATGVMGVTTSHVARKQGFAAKLLAQTLAADVRDGAVLAVLGMFEQGFYNRLGFGTGTYEHIYAFDPAHLRARVPARTPRRLKASDGSAMHLARLARIRPHGGLNVRPEAVTTSEFGGDEEFGLGYADGPNGELTHYVWVSAKDREHGPYRVLPIYATWDQFHELMGLLKNLGDQVHLVSLEEPPGIQFQDLIDQPFKHRRVTKQSKFEANCRTCAYWQVRICDLPACLGLTDLDCEPVRLNLEMADPIEPFLEGEEWQGAGGSYVVTLGRQSSAEPGVDPGAPTLHASVGAFSRLWLGVRSATALSVTDDLRGPDELLQRLDRALRLPAPVLGWDI